MMLLISSHEVIPKRLEKKYSPPAALKIIIKNKWRCRMKSINNKKNDNITCKREMLGKRIQQNPTNRNRMDGPLAIKGLRSKHTAVAC